MNVALSKMQAPDEHAAPDAPPWASLGDLVDDADPDGELPLPRAVAGAPEAGGGVASGLCASASEPQLVAWIAAVAEKDERALAALYDATCSRVFGLVRRIVRDTALAEEVVEAAYFQVWRQALRFDPARGKALTWLLAMARSRAIDALRRETRFRCEALDEEAQHEAAGNAAGADELLDAARHHADLHRALLLLGAQPRQLVSLAFFRGMSHEEIAQHTRLPLGTVKSQIRRALGSLRRLLGEAGAGVLVS